MADLPDPVASPEENKLEYAYSLWFTQRTRGSVSTSSNYEENIKFVGSFCTVGNPLSKYKSLRNEDTPLIRTLFHSQRAYIKSRQILVPRRTLINP